MAPKLGSGGGGGSGGLEGRPEGGTGEMVTDGCVGQPWSTVSHKKHTK